MSPLVRRALRFLSLATGVAAHKYLNDRVAIETRPEQSGIRPIGVADSSGAWARVAGSQGSRRDSDRMPKNPSSLSFRGAAGGPE